MVTAGPRYRGLKFGAVERGLCGGHNGGLLEILIFNFDVSIKKDHILCTGEMVGGGIVRGMEVQTSSITRFV